MMPELDEQGLDRAVPFSPDDSPALNEVLGCLSNEEISEPISTWTPSPLFPWLMTYEP